MDPRYEPYVWLSVSLIAAVLVDYLVVRLLLDIVRPVTAYVFWIGRAGKLISLLLWCAFFNRIWYPKWMSQGAPVPSMVTAAQWAVAGVILLLAVTSIPRGSAARGPRDA